MNDKGVMVGDCIGTLVPGLPQWAPTIWIDGKPLPLASFYTGADWNQFYNLLINRTTGELLAAGLVKLQNHEGVSYWTGVWVLHPLFSSEADFNGDCQVNATDIAILLGDWGKAGYPTDLNQDGIVDGADLGLVLGNWTSMRGTE
jgi:hypothetical protein